MQADITKQLMVAPTALVRLRIAGRRLALCWDGSEWMQPFAIALLILAVLLAPIVWVLVEVW